MALNITLKLDDWEILRLRAVKVGRHLYRIDEYLAISDEWFTIGKVDHDLFLLGERDLASKALSLAEPDHKGAGNGRTRKSAMLTHAAQSMRIQPDELDNCKVSNTSKR